MRRNDQYFGQGRENNAQVPLPPPPQPYHQMKINHMDGSFAPNLPVYYEGPPQYEYMNIPPPSDGFQNNRYSNWQSEPKGHVMMPPPMQQMYQQDQYPPIKNDQYPPSLKNEQYAPSIKADQFASHKTDSFQNSQQFAPSQSPYPPPSYSQSSLHGSIPPLQQQNLNPPPPQYPQQFSAQSYPQMNILQRISNIIKAQLPSLQSIVQFVNRSSMAAVQDRRVEQRRVQSKRWQRSRSRSRSRSPRDRKDRNKKIIHNEWACPKCAFSNFDFRDKCKKCGESRNSQNNNHRNYIPSSEDWRCPKCNNINYARRTECNRCHTQRK